MTPQERAAKIFRILQLPITYDPRNGIPESNYMAVAAQIEEAVREAIEDMPIVAAGEEELFEYRRGFAAAREKAALVAETYFGKGINAFADRIAEQIRAVEPGE
jgi:endo-alpha-1,4-polygalactosaminidase (GH114 family)